MRAIRTDAGAGGAVGGAGGGPRLVRDAPVPAPRPGEVLVRVRLAAITALDLAAARGRLGFAGILGHRFVGVVEDVSALPEAQRAGLARRRVAVWPGVACGHCDLCKGGLSNHCRARTVPGIAGRDGGLAELATVPAAALCPLPEHVDDAAALLSVPLAIASHAGSIVPRRAEGFISVLGDNELALLTALLLWRENPRVRLLGARREALALADRWGVKNRPIDEAGRRADQDAVMECSSTHDALTQATRFVRPRGTIVLASEFALSPRSDERSAKADGVAGGAGEFDLSRIAAGEFSVVGARGGSVAEGVRLLAERTVDPTGLITRRIRLEEALAELKAPPTPAGSEKDNRGEWLAPVAVEIT